MWINKEWIPLLFGPPVAKQAWIIAIVQMAKDVALCLPLDGVKTCQMACKPSVTHGGGQSGSSDLKCPHPKLPEGTNYWTFKKACGWTPQCANCNAGEFCCRTVADDNQCAWGCVTPVQKTNWKACPHLGNVDHSTFWKTCRSNGNSGGGKWGWGSKCPDGCPDDQQCCAKKTDAGTCAFECATKLDVTPKSGSCPNSVDDDWLKSNKIYCYISKRQGLVAESDCRHDGDCEGNRKCCSPAAAEDDRSYAKCRRVCSTPVGEDEQDDVPLEV